MLFDGGWMLLPTRHYHYYQYFHPQQLERKQLANYLYHERGKRRSVSLPNILCDVKRTDLLLSMQLAFICSFTKSDAKVVHSLHGICWLSFVAFT